ncbi:hypothetical protein [Kaistella flava (ex Peng et al. 2021)]|uniref:hypothetical protein n=1 Tax=Kaistella flava (ex Peng et al. 2021) TaxID=2038776 RepID=UPI00187F6A06|nr:hypothetical protein [Kaistella flava (ex Peng et al. 2021)]
MKITKPTAKNIKSIKFHTGIKSLVDRKFGGINVLDNDQILMEQSKLKNLRNGKVRP